MICCLLVRPEKLPCRFLPYSPRFGDALPFCPYLGLGTARRVRGVGNELHEGCVLESTAMPPSPLPQTTREFVACTPPEEEGKCLFTRNPVCLTSHLSFSREAKHPFCLINAFLPGALFFFEASRLVKSKSNIGTITHYDHTVHVYVLFSCPLLRRWCWFRTLLPVPGVVMERVDPCEYRDLGCAEDEAFQDDDYWLPHSSFEVVVSGKVDGVVDQTLVK